MRNIAISLILLALSTGVALGQSPANNQAAGTVQQRPASTYTPEQKAEHLTKHMSKYLALSPEQEPKVHAVNLERMQTIATLESKQGAERAAYLKALPEPLHQTYEKQLKTVLTPEQLATYEARKAQLAGEAKAKHEQRRKEQQEAKNTPATKEPARKK